MVKSSRFTVRFQVSMDRALHNTLIKMCQAQRFYSRSHGLNLALMEYIKKRPMWKKVYIDEVSKVWRIPKKEVVI